jgi:branched-subunit amino acid aminotransferase/4-amino-4-deoxychorismate lyase
VRVEIDGAPATHDALHFRALTNYGHYTSMQVRDGRVRGWQHHVDRLAAATRELFDEDLAPEVVRDRLRTALRDGASACSVRLDVFRLPDAHRVSVMVSVRPPLEMAPYARSLQSVAYVRPMAHLKHVGTFAQIRYGDEARAAGFDDAVLVGPDTTVLETTIANIGVVDGRTVVWPDGAVLVGTGWQLLADALPAYGLISERRRVRLGDLPTFDAAFVVSSTGLAAVGRVDDLELRADADVQRMLAEAHDALAWDEV